jgi:dTDP-4-amino-4,6-dideoxygalactose transaminase
LALYEYDEAEANNFQYMIVTVDPDVCPFTRDEIVQILHAENVIARRYFAPGCHRSPPYTTMPDTVRWPLPVTERLADTLFAMPTGRGVTLDDIAMIGDILRESLHNRGVVCQALRQPGLTRSAA